MGSGDIVCMSRRGVGAVGSVFFSLFFEGGFEEGGGGCAGGEGRGGTD